MSLGANQILGKSPESLSIVEGFILSGNSCKKHNNNFINLKEKSIIKHLKKNCIYLDYPDQNYVQDHEKSLMTYNLNYN